MGLKGLQDNKILKHFLKATMSLFPAVSITLILITDDDYILCDEIIYSDGIFAKLER